MSIFYLDHELKLRQGVQQYIRGLCLTVWYGGQEILPSHHKNVSPTDPKCSVIDLVTDEDCHGALIMKMFNYQHKIRNDVLPLHSILQGCEPDGVEGFKAGTENRLQVVLMLCCTCCSFRWHTKHLLTRLHRWLIFWVSEQNLQIGDSMLS